MASFMYLFLHLFLAFGFSLVHVLSQRPQGFISLDCGLQESNGYNDPISGLFYTSDQTYIDSGESATISSVYKTNTLPQQFLNLRIFPGPVGTRSCYTLRPLHGKGNKVLLRVGFLYGNYDGESRTPEFDLYLGVDYWDTVAFNEVSSYFITEIFHVPASDYLHLCLVNTGRGTPFISVLELRPIDPSTPEDTYNTTAGSLELYGRWDMGSTSANSLRYANRFTDDPYDRMWRPWVLDNSTTISTTATNFTENWFSVPATVLRTASQALTRNDSIIITFDPSNSSDLIYIYLHWAELLPNSSREMIMYRNGNPRYGPFIPSYLEELTIFPTSPVSLPTYEIKINSTSNSTLPPMLNAFEVYTVKNFPHLQTQETDVAAVFSIKATYAITRNWQGDPCSPKNFSWIGVSCSYVQFETPKIISLNLSSSGLRGNIDPSISNLTRLQSLDLSYNNLSGQVPDFLAWLPSLGYLYIQGNNFTGPLPSVLLEKQRSGSLSLRSDFNVPTNTANPINPACANSTCTNNKTKSNTVTIVASVVGAVFATLVVSVLIFILIRRRRPVAETITSVQLNENVGSSAIEPKLNQFTFSEIMSFVGEKKVLGKGGFGTVYHGYMNGAEVAVKVLHESPHQEPRDFQSEVKILATVHHRNLTKFLGYCNEGTNKAIIFELLENGNLKDHLSEKNQNVLFWELRLSILIDAAQGLEYLHHGCNPPIIHRDIKPENILLTRNFEAKIADFGLSKFFPNQYTSRIMGTPGYHDPEYNESGALSEKIDVYSFGIVMLVVVTGQPATVQGQTHITQWVAPKIRQGDIGGIVDPRLEGNYDVNLVWRVIELAMACVSRNSSGRPNMNYVVKELKECLRTSMAQHEGDDQTNYSSDIDGIGVISTNMRSMYMPRTR